MPTVTVNIPPIGLEGVFSFKAPYNTYVKNTLNTPLDELKLKVISIVSMREMITIDNVDPFVKFYTNVGISESDYKEDLVNEVPIITLVYNEKNAIRIPLSYISYYGNITQISYGNKLLVVDLGILPIDLDLGVYFEDIKDTLEYRVGVRPMIKEVVIGGIESVDQITHTQNETVRNGIIAIQDTNELKLNKLSILYNNLLARFNRYRVEHP